MPAMEPIERLLRLFWPLLSLYLILLVIVAIAGLSGSILFQRTVADGLIKLVIVVGIYIFMGNSGVLAFGSIVYMMIGAYASAWMTLMPNLKKFNLPGLPDILMNHQYDPVLSIVVAGLLAAAVAFIVALAIMRMSDIAVSIASFAVLAMGYTIYNNWETVTLGTSSIIGLPMYVNMYVCFLWAAIAMLIAFLHQVSRFGLLLRAAREDQAAARAGGVNIYLQRVIAFTLSGFVVGLAGVLHGHFLGILTVNAFWIPLTFITLAMLVVGGQTSLAGAVVGVITVITVTEVLRQLEKGVGVGETTVALPLGVQEIVLGTMMLLILVFRPSGIMGGYEIPWPFGRRRARAAAPEPADGTAPSGD